MTMSPSANDLAAARRISSVRTNPLIAGLPGADKCLHRLMGAGEPVDDYIRRTSSLPGDYATKPYRHHSWVRNEFRSPEGYCICGNPKSHRIHVEYCEGIGGPGTRP